MRLFENYVKVGDQFSTEFSTKLTAPHAKDPSNGASNGAGKKLRGTCRNLPCAPGSTRWSGRCRSGPRKSTTRGTGWSLDKPPIPLVAVARAMAQPPLDAWRNRRFTRLAPGRRGNDSTHSHALCSAAPPSPANSSFPISAHTCPELGGSACCYWNS